jgi:hypothetical protein
MSADSDSRIAWHRVQLKKNREALKDLEQTRFTAGEIRGSRKMSETTAELRRKIAESQHCIAEYERQTKRPLGTDFRSLADVNWSTWNAHGAGKR